MTSEACDHCGRTSAPTHDEQVYVGRHSFQWRRKCDDNRSCWAAWSIRQNAARADMAAKAAAAEAEVTA